MKKTLLLLALLLAPQTIEALSIQCEGIALSTGVQCKKKIALKHNTTLCHHHIDTDYTVAEDIDFNHSKQTSTYIAPSSLARSVATLGMLGFMLFCIVGKVLGL